MKLQRDLIQEEKLLACGENDSLKGVLVVWKKGRERDDVGLFPPDIVIQIKAIACELPAIYKIPISRWSAADIARYACQSGLVASISDSTVWRWLHEDAIRPWQYRTWIFPRDPCFFDKAGRILDLYERKWEGKNLEEDEYVLSADEKTSIQARRRRHATYPAQSHSPMKVEHEYKRCGAWAYIAALDVHQIKLFGLCEKKSSIVAFDLLVERIMMQSPYKKARRVFFIVDNGSIHRGSKAITRIQGKYPNLILVHTPIHASWLNQIEIYFSILQRKVLTPNYFSSLHALKKNILGFQDYYEEIAKPFEWKFTRNDLNKLINKIKTPYALSNNIAA